MSFQGSTGLHQKPEPACTAGPGVGVLHWAGTREVALAEAGVQKAKLVGVRRLGLLSVGRPAVSFGFGGFGRRSTAGAGPPGGSMPRGGTVDQNLWVSPGGPTWPGRARPVWRAAAPVERHLPLRVDVAQPAGG